MVKSNNVRLIINNKSGISMEFKEVLFYHGRLAESYRWDDKIEHGDTMDILCYEFDYSWNGCSGFVQYSMGEDKVDFAFSNPFWGTNKLEAGHPHNGVWDNMRHHEYTAFDTVLKIEGLPLNFTCKSTPGTTNVATVCITPCRHHP
jgi:hypothetical protein